jgi:hypothetical protein
LGHGFLEKLPGLWVGGAVLPEEKLDLGLTVHKKPPNLTAVVPACVRMPGAVYHKGDISSSGALRKPT